MHGIGKELLPVASARLMSASTICFRRRKIAAGNSPAAAEIEDQAGVSIEPQNIPPRKWAMIADGNLAYDAPDVDDVAHALAGPRDSGRPA
jgi:hypothetical protein